MNAVIALCHFCEIHGPSVLFCTQPIRSQSTPSRQEQDDKGDHHPLERRVKSPQTTEAGAAGDHSNKTSDLCDACRSLPASLPGYVSHDTEAQVSYVSSQTPHHPQVFSMVRQACVRSLSCEVCPGREGPIFFGEEEQGYVLSYTFYISDSQARGLQRWYSIIIVMNDKIYLLNSWPFLVSHLQNVISGLQTNATKVYDVEQAKCPQRALRLGTSSISPANFRQQRGGTAVRSLIELTNDKNLFGRLHLSFTWILKACGNRITEKLLEGPPTEDSIIDLEKQEDTEEGFVKLFSKKLTVDSSESEEDKNAGSLSDDECAEEIVGIPTFKNLRHLWKVLGDHEFHALAHHVVIGNQVIIRGDEKPLIKSMINCLKTLLPKGCCRAITYSHSYHESWRCNFLGLQRRVQLPSHLEYFVLVNIRGRKGSITEDQQDFVGYDFVLQSPTELPLKYPSVLSKMARAITNDNLNYTVVESMLVCLKEEWMNKVKVLFKFTKAGGSRTEQETKKLLQVVQAQEEDKQVLKFWMTGLSVQYKNHMLTTSMDNPR